jgi:hypothetical protein
MFGIAACFFNVAFSVAVQIEESAVGKPDSCPPHAPVSMRRQFYL